MAVIACIKFSEEKVIDDCPLYSLVLGLPPPKKKDRAHSRRQRRLMSSTRHHPAQRESLKHVVARRRDLALKC